MRYFAIGFFVFMAVIGLGCSDKDEGSPKGMLPPVDSDAYSSFTADDCPSVCEFVSEEGECIGDIHISCVDGLPVCEDCAAVVPIQNICVFDTVENTAACRPLDFINPDCIPDCTDVECGDNGCGGSCGFCPEGSVCDGAVCRLFGEPCGSVEAKGTCINEVLTSCVNGGLTYINCDEIGRVCALNVSTGMYDCLLL